MNHGAIARGALTAFAYLVVIAALGCVVYLVGLMLAQTPVIVMILLAYFLILWAFFRVWDDGERRGWWT